jgi:hypothetical protein
MLSATASHIRGNLVAYLALFAALGGTSYAAVGLAPGSVTSRALANGAVTHSKLAASSVSDGNVMKHSLTPQDFRTGSFQGPAGPQGKAGVAGKDGTSSVVMSALSSGSATAPHGASTDIPIGGATWTQAANDANLIMGSMSVRIPSSCTGSFGNSLALLVDGVGNTFGVLPTAPASTTVTVPFVVSELMPNGSAQAHTITLKAGNSCTRSGEDFAISNVKVDVVNFH